MSNPDSRVILRQDQAFAANQRQVELGVLGEHASRNSKFKQAVLLSWWLGVALICTVVTGVRSLAGSFKHQLFDTFSIRVRNSTLKISPLTILIIIAAGVITAVSMEWLVRITSLSRHAYSYGDDCCQVWATCNLHIRLSTLVDETRRMAPRHSAPGSLYAVLDVEPTVQGAKLRGAARSTVQRVEQGWYSDGTEPLVTELFRAAQFLELEKNRRLYDRVFLPVVRSETGLAQGATISPPPHQAMDVPSELGPICSAAFDACCDAARDSF